MNRWKSMALRGAAVASVAGTALTVSATGASAVGQNCEQWASVQRCANIVPSEASGSRGYFMAEATDVTGTQQVKIRRVVMEAQELVNGQWRTFFGASAGENQDRQIVSYGFACRDLPAGRQYRSLGTFEWRAADGQIRSAKIASNGVWKSSFGC